MKYLPSKTAMGSNELKNMLLIIIAVSCILANVFLFRTQQRLRSIELALDWNTRDILTSLDKIQSENEKIRRLLEIEDGSNSIGTINPMLSPLMN